MSRTEPNKVPPRISTIPYAPTSPGWPPIHPRSLAPIRAHPSLDTIPAPGLPISPRPPVFHTSSHGVYQISTHLVPAAYPRHTPDIPLPVVPVDRRERHDKMRELLKEVGERQEAFIQGKLEGQPSEKLLWICVNRYVRTSGATTSGGGVTLFLVHATGFHKETWETTIRTLLDAPAGKMVEEVWTWDAVQHGDSALVNAQNLSGISEWLDNTRDIVNFLLNYLPERVEATALPTRLQRLPESAAKCREEHGYGTRKLVVVAHSLGGCTSLRAAIDFPKLFSSFVLVDPAIYRPDDYPRGYLDPIVFATFTRRDRWSSREKAHQWLKKSSFFGAWHPKILQDYVDYAMIDDGEGGVTLKTTGFQEGLTLVNSIPPCEMWVLLEKLDERIALRWVIPEEPMVNEERGSETIWRRPANSTNVWFHFAGHLLVQEAPCELAHDLSDFLVRQYEYTKAHL